MAGFINKLWDVAVIGTVVVLEKKSIRTGNHYFTYPRCCLIGTDTVLIAENQLNKNGNFVVTPNASDQQPQSIQTLDRTGLCTLNANFGTCAPRPGSVPYVITEHGQEMCDRKKQPSFIVRCLLHSKKKR
ncbi:unnamed protein product, partial [Allacma fusca]